DLVGEHTLFVDGASSEFDRGLGDLLDEEEFFDVLGLIVVGPEVDLFLKDLGIFVGQNEERGGEAVFQSVGAALLFAFFGLRSGGSGRVLLVDPATVFG